MSNNTSHVIKNAEIFWAKLDKPVSPFGGDMAYEAQFRFAKSRLKELEGLGFTNIKEVEGKLAVNLKRYAHNKNGDATPVRVVDGEKNEARKDNIGNGSKVNFIVFQYESKRGLVSRLTAVQVNKLVEYKKASSVDFDVAEGSVDF